MQFTRNYSQNIDQIYETIMAADAILVGAGAGLSTSAGLTYSGERFMKYFSDFHRKYGITDMYSGGFYPFDSLEEYWAWWSRHIYYNRYDVLVGEPYKNLLKLIQNKEYFVLTTNVDHQFQKANFDKKRLFYTQGDYGLFQCSVPCHRKNYDNESIIREMILSQKEMKIPSERIPVCPVCGKPMSVNLRCDATFVEDSGWQNAAVRYATFIKKWKYKKIVFLELGVGRNTPGIIKYPFWQMTARNPKATYICINLGEAITHPRIEKQSICIDEDIGKILDILCGKCS